MNASRKKSIARRVDFQIVDGRTFAAVGYSFDANLVAGAQRHACRLIPGRGVAVGFVIGKQIIGCPFIDDLSRDEQPVLRCAVILVEIYDADGKPTGLAVELHRDRALTIGINAFGGLPTGRRFPGLHVPRLIAFQRERFGFEAIRVIADAPLVVGNAGIVQEPSADGVAPNFSVACLVPQFL